MPSGKGTYGSKRGRPPKKRCKSCEAKAKARQPRKNRQ